MMYLATNSSHLSEEFTATQHIAARTATERFRKPKSTNLQKKKNCSIKNELDAAVKEQNFERAAELRDTIKGMEA